MQSRTIAVPFGLFSIPRLIGAGFERLLDGWTGRVQHRMQSFLPYPDFARTAAVLDPRRLGKQRVEALQILRGLTVPGYGWRHHPAVKMWTGYEEALVRYGLEICSAWTATERPDTCSTSLMADLRQARDVRTVRDQAELGEAGELPPWLGDEAFHRSHRSALLRKDPDFYGAFFDDPPDLPYVWPASDRLPRPSEQEPRGQVRSGREARRDSL